MPLAIYMGMRASRLEAQPRRPYGSEGLLGSSLAGQLQRHTRKRRDAPHPLTVVSKGLPLTVSFLGTRGSSSKSSPFGASKWCKLRFSSRKCFWSWAKLPKRLLVERFEPCKHTLARLGPGPFKGSIPKHRCINPGAFMLLGPAGPWALQGPIPKQRSEAAGASILFQQVVV